MRVFSKIFWCKWIVGRQTFVQYIRMLYLGFIDLNRTVNLSFLVPVYILGCRHFLFGSCTNFWECYWIISHHEKVMAQTQFVISDVDFLTASNQFTVLKRSLWFLLHPTNYWCCKWSLKHVSVEGQCFTTSWIGCCLIFLDFLEQRQ